LSILRWSSLRQCSDWVFGPCYVNDLAFRWVKFHVSFMYKYYFYFKINDMKYNDFTQA